MSTTKVTTRKVFSFPDSTLVSGATRLQTALNQPVGETVLAHFPPTFPTDLSSQLELVSQFVTNQSNAKAAVGDLVKDQLTALGNYLVLANSARHIARIAFPKHDVRLRNAFQVGVREPNDLPSIVQRGEKLLAGCQEFADEVAAFGWSTQKTTALGTALTTLKDVFGTKHVSADGKEGLTSQKAAAANQLYRLCRAIQAVARSEYPKAKIATDPSIANSRARFLLDGEFPPRSGSKPAEQTPPDGASTGGPASGAGPAGNPGTTSATQ